MKKMQNVGTKSAFTSKIYRKQHQTAYDEFYTQIMYLK